MPPHKAPFDKVFLAVFDGLRPDLVNPDLTPNIMRVAARGTWFREARSVFPPVTRVATTSIATGAPPAVHGIVGNKFFHHPAFSDRVFDTSRVDHIRRAEEVHGERFVVPDTFGDGLAAAGKRLAVVHTGSAGTTHLINPRAKSNGHWTFSILGPDHSPTPEAVEEVAARLGPLPERTLPRFAELTYASRVMTEHVLPAIMPDVAVIWFNEPDTTFHYKEIGSAEASAIIRHVDAELGRILDWLDAQPDADRTLVLLASDHGQIATSDACALFDRGRREGFAIGQGDQLNGATFIATGGRSGEIRIRNGSADDVSRIARWLLDQEEVSHVFSRGNGEFGSVAGTLSLDAVGLGHDRSPDLFFTLASHSGPDHRGLPGVGLTTPGDVAVGGGQHGGLNPHELNSVLIVGRGGVAQQEQVDDPAGIIDIAPTILGALGLEPARSMIGRNLLEEAREEPRVHRLGVNAAGRQRQLDVVDQDGRRFILGDLS